MIDSHRQAFIEEATELLTELESSLLELEINPTDSELIAKVFRALHTVKGSSAMFGYDDISMFTHDIENVYDYIRKGELKVTKDIIELTLAARDQIYLMLLPAGEDSLIDENVTKKILESFRNIVTKHNSHEYSQPNKVNKKTWIDDKPKQEKRFHIIFKPNTNIFHSGTNPLLLLNELRQVGDTICLAKFDQIPLLDRIDAEKCYASWEMILKTTKDYDAIKDVFIFIEDQCELKITEIDQQGKLFKEEDFNDFKKLISDLSKTKFPNFAELLLEFESSATQPLYNYTLTDVKDNRENIESHHEGDSVSSLRVSAEKLDELVNLVGELVTIQARLTQIALNSQNQSITSISEEVERITWSLRDSALNIRMLPIGTTFSKFKRLVRDLSKELGKEVELTTAGAETELDKTVIEKLNDPLIHIIRNSIDHGIESPAEREQKGKARTGKVHLSASQSGGNVLIKIKDDGSGMDKDAIREKAVKMGLIPESGDISDSEIYSLIFAAGFSTAKKVTNVSGRGVGMDVVRRAIDALRGTVEVSSKKGFGTTITLKLPLTLAIIDGLLVNIGDELYIMPLSSVEECIELTSKDVANAHGRHIVNIRGEIVPYINLRERFSVATARPEIEQVVIAHIKGMRAGFVVDKVIGQHQTVLKTLGKVYKNVEGISGATILGDGTVALILDLIKLTEDEEMLERSIK